MSPSEFLQDPRAQVWALAIVVGALVWAWRRWWPRSFERLPARFQALPPAILGAVAGGGLSSPQGLVEMVVGAAFGAGAGLMATGGHEALKRLPGPYTGGSESAAKSKRKGAP